MVTDDPRVLLARCRAMLAYFETPEYKSLADGSPAYLSTMGRHDIEREIELLEAEIEASQSKA